MGCVDCGGGNDWDNCDALEIKSRCGDAVSDPIDYAKHRSRSHGAVIRIYDATGNVIGTHEHAGEFKEL
jgi:hypothetical protein